ncbi:MAG: glucuronate isomerase [Clostridiales bacterium]|nr:glucuronate isomerase [Clostridiales bacterium]
MQNNYLLPSKTAQTLYQSVRELPIYDYHCHLSPKEIWEDKPFDNIGEMWLAGDHYKWRLMRAAGISEDKITGTASWKEKFLAYAQAISLAAGNPLYHWTQMELSLYFGIETALSPDTAEVIWDEANRVIAEKKLSPRKLMKQANTVYVATTDDVADSLEYHRLLQNDDTLSTKVTPSFRTDNLLQIRRPGYRSYIEKLSAVSEIEITDLASYDAAIEKRLRFFIESGCRFTDVGLPSFPDRIGSDAEADDVLRKAIAEETISDAEYSAFLGRMYLFLGKLYQKYNVVMQLHLAVQRNINTPLFQAAGADSGGDCIGDPIPGQHLIAVLDAIHQDGGLPETILYTLNPVMNDQLCAIAGSFPHVRVGAAWWFNDHKEGIEEVIRTIARVGHIGSFLGMLTDSRSFLSYARHDYFRRILCSILAGWQDSGEFAGDTEQLAKAICCDNIKNLIEKGKKPE